MPCLKKNVKKKRQTKAITEFVVLQYIFLLFVELCCFVCCCLWVLASSSSDILFELYVVRSDALGNSGDSKSCGKKQTKSLFVHQCTNVYILQLSSLELLLFHLFWLSLVAFFETILLN
jgi:hypothetical protein